MALFLMEQPHTDGPARGNLAGPVCFRRSAFEHRSDAVAVSSTALVGAPQSAGFMAVGVQRSIDDDALSLTPLAVRQKGDTHAPVIAK